MNAHLQEAPLVPDPEPTLPAPEAVTEFLRAHPDFLAQQPDLYRLLNPPIRVHGERVADHMAAMIAAERRRLRAIEAELVANVTARRVDLQLTMRVRLAVVALMRAQDVAEAINEELPALLGIETCTLLSEAPDRRGVVPLPRGAVARLVGRGRDAVVRIAPTETDLIHQSAAPLVVRDALVKVPTWNSQPTMLALGTRDPSALPAKQATATLAFLGRVVAAALAR